ncbi:MAG TPA: multi antimicrobial extrusion protein MatE [Paenibacillaceae bacterium]
MDASEGNAASTGTPAASPAGLARLSAEKRGVSAARILKFFLPLGLSASLVTLSHVIINGTLARAPQPELVIAGYAIAQSIFMFTERPAVLIRQTSSALVRDRTSFRALGRLTFGLIALIVLIGSIIAFTPLGPALIRWVFGADDRLAASALNAYGVVVFVSVFSALRCLYHGVLIRERNTKWLTLGMLIRLAVMYAASVIILETGVPVNGAAGAFIFLIGMATEAAFGYFEGRLSVRKLPERDPASTVARVRDIFPFYRPLVLSSFIAVLVAPAINVVLGKTANMNLAIASYAVASSVTNLMLSFFSYSHQMALQFFHQDSRTTLRVIGAISIVPPVLVIILAFTPAGYWVLRLVVGAEGQLLAESLAVLKFFLPHAALFAWVDFCQGLMMLRNQTNILVKSQTANVLTVMAALAVAIAAVPEWNGRIGAMAMSAGYAAELIVLLAVLRIFHRRRQLTTP